MDSDRWKQVDNLLQAVLERPPASATHFCGRPARATQRWNAKSAPF